MDKYGRRHAILPELAALDTAGDEEHDEASILAPQLVHAAEEEDRAPFHATSYSNEAEGLHRTASQISGIPDNSTILLSPLGASPSVPSTSPETGGTSEWSEEDKERFRLAVLYFKKDLDKVSCALSRPSKDIVRYYYEKFKLIKGSGYAELKVVDRVRPIHDDKNDNDVDENSEQCYLCGASTGSDGISAIRLFGCDECNAWLCFDCTGAADQDALLASDSYWACAACLKGEPPIKLRRRSSIQRDLRERKRVNYCEDSEIQLSLAGGSFGASESDIEEREMKSKKKNSNSEDVTAEPVKADWRMFQRECGGETAAEKHQWDSYYGAGEKENKRIESGDDENGKTQKKRKKKRQEMKQEKEKIQCVKKDSWVQCEVCDKWRKLPLGVPSVDVPINFRCHLNRWDRAHQSCDAEEEPENNALTSDEYNADERKEGYERVYRTSRKKRLASRRELQNGPPEVEVEFNEEWFPAYFDMIVPSGRKYLFLDNTTSVVPDCDFEKRVRKIVPPLPQKGGLNKTSNALLGAINEGVDQKRQVVPDTVLKTIPTSTQNSARGTKREVVEDSKDGQANPAVKAGTAYGDILQKDKEEIEMEVEYDDVARLPMGLIPASCKAPRRKQIVSPEPNKIHQLSPSEHLGDSSKVDCINDDRDERNKTLDINDKCSIATNDSIGGGLNAESKEKVASEMKRTQQHTIIMRRELQLYNADEMETINPTLESDVVLPQRILLKETALLSSGIVLGRGCDLKAPTGQEIRPSEDVIKRLEVKQNKKHKTQMKINSAKIISRHHTRLFAIPCDSSNVSNSSDISVCRNAALRNQFEVWVQDLNSTNGTFVDDIRLEADEKKRLDSGQILRLGMTGFNVIYRYVETVE